MKWFFWKIEKNNKSSKSASHTHTPHQRVRTEWRLFKFPGNHRRKSLPCQIRSFRRGCGCYQFLEKDGYLFKHQQQQQVGTLSAVTNSPLIGPRKLLETIVCVRLLRGSKDTVKIKFLTKRCGIYLAISNFFICVIVVSRDSRQGFQETVNDDNNESSHHRSRSMSLSSRVGRQV